MSSTSAHLEPSTFTLDDVATYLEYRSRKGGYAGITRDICHCVLAGAFRYKRGLSWDHPVWVVQDEIVYNYAPFTTFFMLPTRVQRYIRRIDALEETYVTPQQALILLEEGVE